MLLGQTLWIVIIAYGCSFLGALQVPVFLSTLIYGFVGAIYDIKIKNNKETSTTREDNSFIEKCASLLDVQSYYTTPMNNNTTTTMYTNDETVNVSTGVVGPSDLQLLNEQITLTPKSKMHLNMKTSLRANSYNNDNVDDEIKKSQSEIYFKVLFLVSIITIIYKYVWMLFFAAVPISIYIINKLIITFGLKNYLIKKWNELTGGIQVI